MQAMAGAYGAPGGTPDGTPPAAQPQPPAPGPAQPGATAPVPGLPPETIPASWNAVWEKAQALARSLPPDKQARLVAAMNGFAQAVASGNADVIEDKAYILQDTIYEVGS